MRLRSPQHQVLSLKVDKTACIAPISLQPELFSCLIFPPAHPHPTLSSRGQTFKFQLLLPLILMLILVEESAGALDELLHERVDMCCV